MDNKKNKGSAFGLFMDDVRIEIDGKHTLVGVYGDAISVPSIPCTIPKFGAACYYTVSANNPVKSLAVKIVQSNGSATEHKIPDEALASAEERPNGTIKYQVIGVLSPFSVAKEGEIKAILVVDGEEIEAASIEILADENK